VPPDDDVDWSAVLHDVMSFVKTFSPAEVMIILIDVRFRLQKLVRSNCKQH